MTKKAHHDKSGIGEDETMTPFAQKVPRQAFERKKIVPEFFSAI
jgi:hypothetical protein